MNIREEIEEYVESMNSVLAEDIFGSDVGENIRVMINDEAVAIGHGWGFINQYTDLGFATSYICTDSWNIFFREEEGDVVDECINNWRKNNG